jgi:hypothetical protein
VTVDPERLAAVAWRAVWASVVLWLASAALVAWLAYQEGYIAGLTDAGAVWP